MGWDGKSAAGELNQIEAIERTTRGKLPFFMLFSADCWVHGFIECYDDETTSFREELVGRF